MSRAPSTFRESDIKRAPRAVDAAGKEAEAVEIEDGRIKIKLKPGKRAADNNDHDNTDNINTNPWHPRWSTHSCKQPAAADDGDAVGLGHRIAPSPIAAARRVVHSCDD